MRLKLTLTALSTSLIVLSGCEFDNLQGMAKFNRDFHSSYDLKANGRVEIDTYNGSVEISGWDQNTVDVSGTKYGPTQQEADDLKVSIDSNADSISIRVSRPVERRNNRGVRLVLKIPRQALLDRITTSNGAIRITDGAGPARLRTSNGQISVSRLHGNVDAETSNGAVDLIDIDGDALAHTSNGRIHAERVNGGVEMHTSNSEVNAQIGRADRPIHVETSNGPVEVTLPEGFRRELRVSTNNSAITLRLPAAVNAHVIARTNNSSISSDFEVRMQGPFSRNHMDGTIGSGGALFDLTTSNGPVRLLKM